MIWLGICGEPCLPCEGGKRCIIQLCPHKKCKAKCEDPCKSGCKEKCGNICPHSGGQPCTKKCGHSSACSGRKSKHCEEVCGKLLKCGHSCKGYCGEKCPTTESCPECNEPSLDINDDPMNRLEKYISIHIGLYIFWILIKVEISDEIIKYTNCFKGTLRLRAVIQ